MQDDNTQLRQAMGMMRVQLLASTRTVRELSASLSVNPPPGASSGAAPPTCATPPKAAQAREGGEGGEEEGGASVAHAVVPGCRE